MRKFSSLLVIAIVFMSIAFTSISAQSRQEAIDRLHRLKLETRAAEEMVLAPESIDRAQASKENANVFRLMPLGPHSVEEFSFVREGGSAFSFYFRVADTYQSHGGDIRLQRDVIERSVSMGENYYSLMTDAGDIGLQQVSPATAGVNTLANLQNVVDLKTLTAKFSGAQNPNLDIEGVAFNVRLPAIVGHTYVIRSVNRNCYDILAAFQIRRKDADGSLIVFWKLLDQYATPVSQKYHKGPQSDEQILTSLKRYTESDVAPDLKISVSDGAVTLTGPIKGRYLSYIVEVATLAGATKVINQMTVK